MAQQFTHTPVKPMTTDDSAKLWWFKLAGGVNVCRDKSKDLAELDVRLNTTKCYANVTASLTADECETIARALLDAAHDLRTHKSADLMVEAVAECVEGGAA